MGCIGFGEEDNGKKPNEANQIQMSTLQKGKKGKKAKRQKGKRVFTFFLVQKER